jgi:hypothetical protein
MIHFTAAGKMIGDPVQYERQCPPKAARLAAIAIDKQSNGVKQEVARQPG